MRPIAFGASILVLCSLLGGVANAHAAEARAIYRCEAGGVLTFSDRPCRADAERYAPDATTLNTFEAPRAQPASERAASKPKPKSKKKSSGSAADPGKRKEQCRRLAGALKDLRSKQRTGYTAREAGRLKDRETKLKSQLREAQCG